MEKISLKGHLKEGDKRKKEAETAVDKLGKTEVDVVRVAEQVGSIKSGLSDIDAMISELRHRAVDSGKKAGEQDAAQVQTQEKAVAGQRKVLEDAAQKSQSEEKKAQAVKPADARIKDGSEIAKVLGDARAKASTGALDLKKTEAKASSHREKSQKAISDAVRRNRK